MSCCSIKLASTAFDASRVRFLFPVEELLLLLFGLLAVDGGTAAIGGIMGAIGAGRIQLIRLLITSSLPSSP